MGKDYIELEYIQSTGTQYIGTNITANYDIWTEIIVSNFVMEGDNGVLLGNYWGMGQYLLGSWDYNLYWCLNPNVEYRASAGTSDTPVKFTMWRYTFKVDDIYINNSSNYTITSNSEIMIFGGISNSSINTRFKLYSLKMWSDSTKTTLLRDFIPVKRKSDDEICLYDKVTRQYFTNQGTGEFIAGPEISESTLYENVSLINTQINHLLNISNQILDKYKELEYLQNSSDAYFELDYKPNSNTK